MPTTGPPGYDDAMGLYSTAASDVDLAYDMHGNLVSRVSGADSESYSYDVFNRLREYTAADGSVTRYHYDALGRRTAKSLDHGTANEATTLYLYAGWHCIEERDEATGNVTAEYVHGKDIDEVIAIRRYGTNYYPHYDGAGNVVALSDENGIVERYDYGDFGLPKYYDAAGAPLTQSAYGNEFLFHGRRYDSESGLYHYRHRQYDPRLGRFTTRDPLGLWGDPSNHGHGYAFPNQNPWTYHDPYGLELMDPETEEFDTDTQSDWSFLKWWYTGDGSSAQVPLVDTEKRQKGGYEDRNGTNISLGSSTPPDSNKQFYDGALDQAIKGLCEGGVETAKGTVTLTAGSAAGAALLLGKAGKVQRHHLIPHNNSKYEHHKRLLVVASGDDLEKMEENFLSLFNHGGRHSDAYHRGVAAIINTYEEKFKKAVAHCGNDPEQIMRQAKHFLRLATGKIERKIRNGSLKPYSGKDVYPVD